MDTNLQGQWYVKDLSRNGTLVNGLKLDRNAAKALAAGDEITVSCPQPASANAVHVM